MTLRHPIPPYFRLTTGTARAMVKNFYFTKQREKFYPLSKYFELYLNCAIPYKIPVFRGKMTLWSVYCLTSQTGVVKISKLSEFSEISHSWFIHTLTPKSITPPNLHILPPSNSIHQKQFQIYPITKPKIPSYHHKTPYRTLYR